MHLKGSGLSTDAKEIKKCCQNGQAALLLKLALDTPLSKRRWLSDRQSEAQTRGNELAY